MSGSLRQLIRRHGRNHRPPGTYGPDDPGGSDPIPFIGAGDYVFLQEIAITEEDSYVEFEEIDQTFRHLVLEGSDNSYGNGDDDGGGDLQVRWGPSGGVLFADYVSAQMLYVSEDNPTFPTAIRDAVADTGVFIKSIVPGRDEFGLGDVNGIFASITLKFLYYTRTDRVKTVRWEAESIVPFGGDGSYHMAISRGGGAQGVPSTGTYDPIERISVDSNAEMPVTLWSLYGIR